MQWKNPGAEFDNLYAHIKNINKLYIFGAGIYGRCLHSLLCDDFEILGFIDNDIGKQNSDYLGLPVYSPDSVMPQENCAVIAAMSSTRTEAVLEQMEELGFCKNQNLFSKDIFVPVWGVYAKSKVVFPAISLLPSTRCNLKCEACLNFTTHNKNHTKRTLQNLKNNVDLFFSCVDYIMQFHLSGGEPLLYDELGQLVEYINSRYAGKIFQLAVTTNGTLMPSDELCLILRKNNTHLIMDDYREAVPEKAFMFEKIKECLERNTVDYSIQKIDKWIDLKPFDTDHSKWSDEQLQEWHKKCNVPYQELRDSKIWSCNYASFAIVAGLIPATENDFLDLKELLNSDSILSDAGKKKLVEFRLGYNKKGYVDFCKRCSGYEGLNKNFVQAARQQR